MISSFFLKIVFFAMVNDVFFLKYPFQKNLSKNRFDNRDLMNFSIRGFEQIVQNNIEHIIQIFSSNSFDVRTISFEHFS